MAKNILFFADGTWNGVGRDSEEDDTTAGDATNVWRIFDNLAGTANGLVNTPREEREIMLWQNADCVQVAKYLHGIGDSRSKIKQLIGGATGKGFAARCIRGYTFISRHYVPGDRIFIVGFSRGAYTARALGGMITKFGLLNHAQLDISDDTAGREKAYCHALTVWHDYRSAVASQVAGLHGMRARVVNLFRRMTEHALAVRQSDLVAVDSIAAIAVFDTVGALGVPIFGEDNQLLDVYQFADTELNTKVKEGLHAVAIDDRRGSFTPTLWQPRQGVTQVWFAGAHADVGGGYADDRGLSDIAGQWMQQQLADRNVRFMNAPRYQFAPQVSAQLHKPHLEPQWILMPRITRQIPEQSNIHDSVIARMQSVTDYQPTLPINRTILTTILS